MSPLTVTPANGFVSHHDDAHEVPSLSFCVGHENLQYEKNLPAPEIHRRALAARRLQGKAHHLLSRWLLDMEERGLFREFGCSSVFMYAELHLHLEGHTVAEYLRAGRALKHFPLLAEAYEQGTLSASKLREITRVVTKESEAYWLDVARTHSTRQIEKMVVFSPRRATSPASEKRAAFTESADPSRSLLAGQKIGSASSPSTEAEIPLPGFSTGNADRSSPTMGSQGTGGSHLCAGIGGSAAGQGVQDSSAGTAATGHGLPDFPADEPASMLHCRVPGGRPHGPAETMAHSCESETLPAPQAPDARYYVEKMVIELSAEQAAIIHDALKRARKGSGGKDRASLFAHMARVFLEGAREGGDRSSRKPPYQVVIHHHPASGAAWTEGEKGSPLVSGPVLEKVLCDADILEIPAAGGEQDATGQRPPDARNTAGGEQDAARQRPPDTRNAAGGEQDAAGQRPQDTRNAAGGEQDAAGQRPQDAPGKRDAAGGEASAAAYAYPAGIDEPEGEETPREQVNRLCQAYRKKAYREKASLQRRSDGAGSSREKKGHRGRKSTIPPSMRRKVLLRDGYRCKAPGCTRTQFLAVHHIRPQGAGGGHSLANCLVLCSGCHERVHEGKMVIEGEAPDRLTWRRV